MSEKPILFSPPMVKAILEGRKDQTRRIMQCTPYPGGTGNCPHGEKGTKLWVRETFSPFRYPIVGVCFKDGAQKYKGGSYYPPLKNYSKGALGGIKWKPSIHMPRWASRITLEITDVRVERLQSISEADAKAEGVHLNSSTHWATEARDAFAALWDTIHGKGAWKTNPWVWRIQFKPM